MVKTGGWSDSPAIADGTLYVGAGGRVCALGAATGAQEWCFDTGVGHVGPPTIVGGTVYVGSREGIKDVNNYVFALDRATGTELWRFQGTDFPFSSPVVVDGVVYVAGEDGYLYAITGE